MMQFFKTAKAWTRINPRFLPFADVATADLPLSRLLRCPCSKSRLEWLLPY
jgi:BCD family chlorophyll transporter-like MFS transporter